MLGSCCQKDKTHRRSSKDRAKCFYVGFRHNVNRVQREGSIEMMKILIRPLITFSRTHTHTPSYTSARNSLADILWKTKCQQKVVCACKTEEMKELENETASSIYIHTYKLLFWSVLLLLLFGTAYVLLHFTNKFKTTNNSLDWLENIYNGNKNACLNISNTKFDITHPLQLIKYFYHKYRGHMLVLVVVVHFVEK